MLTACLLCAILYLAQMRRTIWPAIPVPPHARWTWSLSATAPATGLTGWPPTPVRAATAWPGLTWHASSRLAPARCMTGRQSASSPAARSSATGANAPPPRKSGATLLEFGRGVDSVSTVWYTGPSEGGRMTIWTVLAALAIAFDVCFMAYLVAESGYWGTDDAV
jgi:hypothetical protein